MDDPGNRSRDFISALLFVALGGAALLMALGYPLGTPQRIGPGALPLGLGGLLVAVGAALGLQAWSRGPAAGSLLGAPSPPKPRALRAVLFVTLSLVAFALLVRPMGLFIATAVLAVVARQAEPDSTLLGTAVIALSLAAVCAGIFVYAIGLPFRVWPV